MSKPRGAISECQRVPRRRDDGTEAWREQAMAGCERLLKLAEAGDEEALERVQALGAFLRAMLEYLQAAEQLEAALGRAKFQIQDSRFQTGEFEIGDLRFQNRKSGNGEFGIGDLRFRKADA